MYRVALPEGEIDCADYEHIDDGVELYDDDGRTIAFVPYSNLHVVINEEVHAAGDEDERSIM